MSAQGHLIDDEAAEEHSSSQGGRVEHVEDAVEAALGLRQVAGQQRPQSSTQAASNEYLLSAMTPAWCSEPPGMVSRAPAMQKADMKGRHYCTNSSRGVCKWDQRMDVAGCRVVHLPMPSMMAVTVASAFSLPA